MAAILAAAGIAARDGMLRAYFQLRGDAMKTAVAFLAAFAAATAFAQDPLAALKGKMKAGLYAYKMEMDMGQMPGMPPGMGKQTMNMQHCVTPQDIEKGELGKGKDAKDRQDCQISDFKMSGNTASYRMTCKGDAAMTADNTITFVPDGYRMNMKMAMNHGGQTMNMNQAVDAKYLGPCK